MIKCNQIKCDFCGSCVAVCPHNAIDLYENYLEINSNCTECMICVNICPMRALSKEDV